MTRKTILMAALTLIPLAASAQTVSVSEMETYLGSYNDPAQLLEGVAGVRVGATDGSVNGALNVSIRGLGSVRGTTGPLWIIDGVQMNSQFADNVPAFFQWGCDTYNTRLSTLGILNLYDIESIQVLKDVSATAEYGSQGAGGVIIVKTKKPVSGGFNLTWNSSVGVNTAGRFSHNHSVAVHSRAQNTSYSLSGFYRDLLGSVANTGNRVGGARLCISARGVNDIAFGADMSFSSGRLDSPSSTAYYGHTPVTRYTTSDWVSDFDDYSKTFSGMVSAYLDIKFLKYFTWKTTFGFDAYTSNRYFWYGNGTEFGKATNGAAADSYTRNLIYKADTRLAFAGFFGGAHFVNADAGVDYHGEISSRNTANGTDFFNHKLRAKGLSLRQSESLIRSYMLKPSTFALFGNAEYSYGKLVGMDLTFRADKVLDYDNSFVCYPGGSLWFDFRTLMKGASALDRLKLRLGYGLSASNRFVPMDMYSMYSSEPEPELTKDQRAFFSGHNRVSTGEYNIGLDVSLLGNALKFDAAVYSKSTSDRMTLSRKGEPIDGTEVWVLTDPVTVYDDVMQFTDRGAELSVEARPVWNKTVRWSLNAAAAYNMNRIDSVAEGDSKGSPVSESGLVVNSNVAGGTLGAIIDADRNLYNSVPRLSGNLGTTLSCFGFSLNLLLDGAADYNVVNMNRMLEDKATVLSRDYIEKADFLRLSRASLSYAVPMQKVKWIRDFKVSLTGTNLCTLTSYSGKNPDVNSFSRTNLSYGIDYGSCPAAALFMLGVSVNF